MGLALAVARTTGTTTRRATRRARAVRRGAALNSQSALNQGPITPRPVVMYIMSHVAEVEATDACHRGHGWAVARERRGVRVHELQINQRGLMLDDIIYERPADQSARSYA